MRNEKLRYEDDQTANELFRLAGAALANPADGEPRRDFWRHVDRHGDHEWVKVLKRAAASSHPRGSSAGNALISEAVDDAYGRKHAGQPDWLRGVYRTFERG